MYGYLNRNTSRRHAIKSKHKTNNKIQDLSNNNCYICNNKKYELSCVICKKNTCYNCSNNEICLYCNMKEENKHLIMTHLSSKNNQKREVEEVEVKKKKI